VDDLISLYTFPPFQMKGFPAATMILHWYPRSGATRTFNCDRLPGAVVRRALPRFRDGSASDAETGDGMMGKKFGMRRDDMIERRGEEQNSIAASAALRAAAGSDVLPSDRKINSTRTSLMTGYG